MRPELWNDGWSFRSKPNSFLELTGGSGPWLDVVVPHDAMVTEERSPAVGTPATAFHSGGTYEYRKALPADDDLRGKVVMLQFDGVYRDATVFVNGQFAAHRPYGYSQFSVDLVPYLRFGTDNDIHVTARAHDDSRWYSGAGIYRDVWLVVSDPVHLALDGVRVSTPDINDERAVVVVESTVVNDRREGASIEVETVLVDASGSVVQRDVVPVPLAPGASVTVRQRMSVPRPQRWSVDRPYLYTCSTTLRSRDDGDVVDDATTTFGVRSLSLDAEGGLRINGERVDLRGACIHHDNGVIGAATFARADERRVEILKAAGFNALRSAHNPMSRAMLDACDRLGMLVMDEAFDMWTTSKSDDDYARAFPEWWERDIAGMVVKDFNHPSVVMYSIGNEIMDIGTDGGAAWARLLADAIRSRDGTRFVTSGVQALFAVRDQLGELFAAASAEVDAEAGVNTQMTELFDHMTTAMRSDLVDERTAATHATLDVAGYNYLESRYDLDHERHPNRVILGTENNPRAIDANWRYIQSHDHVIGDFTWTGWDYLGEVGVGRVVWPGDASDDAELGFMGPYPWLTAWCGDIDITGNRRPASYFREIVFGLRDSPYVVVERPGHVGQTPVQASPWSWSDTVASWTWPGHEGEVVRVEVYSDADEVELFVNGRSVGRAPSGPTNRYQASFETRYAPGELTAVAYRDGREDGSTGLRSASGDVLVDARAERDQIATDGRDLGYVTVTLVDRDGTPYTSADREVTVDVEGPAVLQGFGSGNPRTEERFFERAHTTFDGRALAVVRPTGSGVITVTVAAQGCVPTEVHITAT